MSDHDQVEDTADTAANKTFWLTVALTVCFGGAVFVFVLPNSTPENSGVDLTAPSLSNTPVKASDEH